MDSNKAVKKKFLTVYDYGTGGVWTYIYARSAKEIQSKYPQLEILDAEPGWFTEQDRVTTTICDVDDEPDQFLLMMRQNSPRRAQ